MASPRMIRYRFNESAPTSSSLVRRLRGEVESAREFELSPAANPTLSSAPPTGTPRRGSWSRDAKAQVAKRSADQSSDTDSDGESESSGEWDGEGNATSLQRDDGSIAEENAVPAAPKPKFTATIPTGNGDYVPITEGVKLTQKRKPRDPSKPCMAVVLWRGVTKAQFEEYRDDLFEKYGRGDDAIKVIQRVGTKIIITAPQEEVMEMILGDEELNPRPEPYKIHDR